MFSVFYTLGCDNCRHLVIMDSWDMVASFIETMIVCIDCSDVKVCDSQGKIICKF